MPLSRLENFIKNVEGNILYVNPSDQDATDSIENQGNSLTRPFKTIQRALIEAARFSYVVGNDNDKFDKTTILLYPGIHKIDNRAGFSILDNSGSPQYKNRFGNISGFSELTSSSNFEIEDPNNVLYHFNSVSGGVIIPRGTSLVGMDLRKTKVYPMFVPDPQNNEIDNTAIFKITGGCYFWQFSMFDGDPNGQVYKNYSTTKFTPNFSHHKLTCFEYADGLNPIALDAVTGGSAVTSTLTDLDTYYFKIANAYGNSSGRPITDWPTNDDIEPKLAENQIVGAVQADPIGITSVFSTNRTDFTFNGAVGRNVVVTTQSAHNLNVGTPILISGITTTSSAVSDDPIFNAQGGAVVSDIISDTKFVFTASEATTVATAYLSGDETVQVEPDTVTGASPYIFNCSLRSVYGVNGLHADGSKATGFKSMVLAQFTGIGLQKDDNAFVYYNEATGAYNDNTTVAEEQKPLHINSKAIYKPDYYSTHVKVSNGAVLQCVSIFAIGFAQHFVADTGGDQSITNSNSNFGAKALIARRFSDTSFDRDNTGYITHIIPPKEVTSVDESVFWVPLDIGITTSYSAANSNAKDRLYTFGYSDSDAPPTHIVDSFRIGSRKDDTLKLEVNNNVESAIIKMEGSETATNEKVVYVSKNITGTANSITESSGSVFGLTGSHEFTTGETVRILSDDGNLPDGIEDNQVYFVIEGTGNGLNGDQIKLAKTLNETISGNVNPISNVNTIGGSLKIVSRVSDKLPGDSGHPIQYDTTNNNWFINVKGDSSNTIFDAISPLEKIVTSKSFISRRPDNRNLEDRIYKVRYVIPKEFQNAKPPSAGYVIQESSTTIASSQSEYSGNITNTVNHRNIKIIHNVDYNSTAGIATITSELPHKLRPGSSVKLKKIKSDNNTTALDKTGFNGIFDVASVIDTKTFTINIPSSRNPGNYIPIRPSLVTQRDENQPNFSINKYSEVFYIYRIDVVRDYIENFQDGIYHLTCLKGSVNPSSGYFSSFGYSQNVVNLYPQLDRDNYLTDPKASISIAKNDPISKVVTDDLRNSITKEFVEDLLIDNRLAFNIDDIKYTSVTGIATVTTDIQHNLNSVIRVSIANSGEGYGYAGAGSTTIYNAKLTGGSGEGATIRFTVDDTATYNMSNVVIVDGGAGYANGETLTVSPVGIPTYTSGGINYSAASVTIDGVNDGSKHSIQVNNVIDYGTNKDDFNGVYKITGVPSSKQISFLLGANNTGIGTYKRGGNISIAGAAATVTDLKYTDINTGIVTITTATPHGLNLGNKFKLDYNEESSSPDTSVYNGTFTVNERVGLNTFTFFLGDNVAIAATPSSVGKVLVTGYSSQESETDSGRENIERRMNPLYVGITTTLNGALTKTSTSITLSHSNGFVKGDYLQIGPEVLRVKEDFTNNAADIIRGVFSTKVSAHEDGALVKKISPLPVESRRYSILRASGHTFEYVGFGHGNYSASLPQRQDRVLSQDEQLLSQAEKSDGGVVVYTGMNDTGDFYVGNRRLSSSTGQEQTIGIPIPTYVGDDSTGSRLSVIFDDVTVKEFIKVEGGAGGVIQSEFNGPVVFNEKVTQTSDKGADFKLITLKGTDTQNTRRKQTVGINTPADDGDNSIGDIVWKNDPAPGGYLGWVYSDDKWRKFGLIATERASDGNFADSNDESPLGNFTILPSKIGINTNLPRDLIDVQAGLSRFDQLYVAGIATFNETVTLGTVNIDDLDVLSSLDVCGTVSINANGGLGVTFSSATIGVGTLTLQPGIGLTVNSNTSISGYLGISSSLSVGGIFTVTNATDLNSTLDVFGNTSLGGTLYVSGNTDIDGTLDVSGNTSVEGSLTVTSATDLNSTLDVFGNTSLGGTLYVSGNTDIDGTLDVSGNTSIGGTLEVTNATDLNGTLDVCGNTSLGGTLYVSSNTDIDGTLDVCGNTSLGGTLYVSGNTDIDGTLDVSGNTSIGGTLEVTNATDLNGTLDVCGNTCLGGRLDVTGHVSAASATLTGTLSCEDIDVSGNVTTSTLTVTKSATISTLTVSGNVTTSTLTVTKSATISTLTVSGNVTTSTLTVNNNGYVSGTLRVVGNTSLDGTLDVSGATDIGGNTKLNGTLEVTDATDLNNTLDVNGNTSLGGTLFVSGNTDINGTLDVSGNTSVGGTLEVTNATDLNGTLDVCGNTCLGGTLVVMGHASFESDITVCGNTLYTGSLTVCVNADLNGTLDVSGNASVGGRLDITGHVSAASATLTGTLSCEDVDVSGNVTTSTLTVTKSATISTLTVSGRVTTSTLTINNKLTGATAVFSGMVSCEDIDVSGNVTTSTLTVTKSATISTLTVSGAATVSTLSVNKSASVSTLTVRNAATISTLTVSGNVTTSTLIVTNYATISTLTVSGNGAIGGRLDITNHVSAASGTFTGMVSCEDIDVSGNVTTSTLTVNNAATISTLTVSGRVTTSTLTVNNVATISTLTINGNGTIGGRLDITSHVSAASGTFTGMVSCEDVDVSGNVTTSTLTVNNAATINSLTVNNAATMGSTLGITGKLTGAAALFGGNICTNGNLYVSLGVAVSGGTTLNTLAVNNSATIGTTLTVTGASTLCGQTRTLLHSYVESAKRNVFGSGSKLTIPTVCGNFVTAYLPNYSSVSVLIDYTSNNFAQTADKAYSLTLFLKNAPSYSNATVTWKGVSRTGVKSNIHWPNGTSPTRTGDANKIDVYTFFTYNGGVDWYGALSIYNYQTYV